MSNRLNVGSKRPHKLDRQTTSQRLVPLPKMFQMGVEKGVKNEQERIVALLESEVWDSPEIATPYVQHIIALIKDERA